MPNRIGYLAERYEILHHQQMGGRRKKSAVDAIRHLYMILKPQSGVKTLHRHYLLMLKEHLIMYPKYVYYKQWQNLDYLKKLLIGRTTL
jgi:hypothetical protein